MSYADVKPVSATKFLKIEINIPKTIRVLESTPIEIFKHEAKKGIVPCTGYSDGCQWCIEGDIPRQKLLTNVYDFDSKRVLIWEFSSTVLKQVQALEKSLAAQEAKIIDVDLTIEATGERFNRKYAITPLLTSQPLPEGLKLHKLDPDLAF